MSAVVFSGAATMRRLDPRELLAITILVATLLPILTLLALYRLGLAVAPSKPVAPEVLLDDVRAAEVFAANDWQGELALEPVDLARVVGIVVCESLSPLRDPGRCRARAPGVLAASRAAQQHLGREGVSGWRAGLGTGSLAVWISRHWTAEQLATYLAESPTRSR